MIGALISATLLFAPVATDPVEIDGHIGGGGSALDVEATDRDVTDASTGGIIASVGYTPREYLRADPCLPGVPAGIGDTCSPGLGMAGTCEAGMTPIAPLWVRLLVNGSWTNWMLVSTYSCPSVEDLYALIEREWAQLKPEPSSLSIQPDGGWVYATIPTIAYATDAPRLHDAVLLGADVTIRATPTTYTWHWGDGETTTTDEPGAAYPAHTISHAYGPTVDAATLSMETTWTGHFQVDGGAWQPFDTTISSTTPGPTLDVLHPRTHLVSNGN